MQSIVERLPRAWAYALAVLAARFAWMFSPLARPRLDYNLAIVCPELTPVELRKISWVNFRNHAKAYADLMMLPRMNVEAMRPLMYVDGLENLAQARSMGKGVLDGKLANVDSIVIVRHGVLVYEHYFDYLDPVTFDAAHKHVSNSMTKSVVSLLVGIAMDRGLMKDLDAPIFSYFPEYADLRTPEKDRITLRNLLTMSSGLHQSMMRNDHDPYRHVLELALVPLAKTDCGR